MNHLGLKVSPANLQFLTLAAIAIALIAIATGHDTPAVLVTAAAILLLTSALTYRSRTLLGWIWHRLTYRRANRFNNRFYRHKQAGVIWDGNRVAAYIEIMPAPYETTIVDGSKITPERSIPIDAIRDELTQYDIHCDHITVYTVGYKYDRQSELAAICHNTIGPTDALFYGRTIVEVSVDISNAIDSLSARKGRGTDADGLNNTVTMAAERVHRRIVSAGLIARLLTDTDLAELDTTLRKNLVPALLDEHWSSAGPKTMQAVSYTPEPGAWTTKNYRQWCNLNPHRHIHAVRLTPGKIADHAEMYVTLIGSDPTALNSVPALGLRVEYGQQGDILTNYIPSVRSTAPAAIPGKALPPGNPFPIALAASGIGTYLGHTKTRERVFVNFTTGAAPFYVISPAQLCQQLLLRLATSGRSIDIAIDTDEWRLFAKRIGVTAGTNPDADIVLSADHPSAQQHPTQVRLVWTTNAANLPRQPDYAIVAGAEESRLYTTKGVTRYRWASNAAEEVFYTFPTNNRAKDSSADRPAPARNFPPPPLPAPTGPAAPTRAEMTEPATGSAQASRSASHRRAEVARSGQRDDAAGQGRRALAPPRPLPPRSAPVLPPPLPPRRDPIAPPPRRATPPARIAQGAHRNPPHIGTPQQLGAAAPKRLPDNGVRPSRTPVPPPPGPPQPEVGPGTDLPPARHRQR